MCTTCILSCSLFVVAKLTAINGFLRNTELAYQTTFYGVIQNVELSKTWLITLSFTTYVRSILIKVQHCLDVFDFALAMQGFRQFRVQSNRWALSSSGFVEFGQNLVSINRFLLLIKWKPNSTKSELNDAQQLEQGLKCCQNKF